MGWDGCFFSHAVICDTQHKLNYNQIIKKERDISQATIPPPPPDVDVLDDFHLPIDVLDDFHY